LKADRLRHRLTLGSEEISFLLRRSPRRRSIGLRIDPAGLTVSIPAHLPQHEWERILVQKSAWILTRLDAMRIHAAPPFVWQAGQMLPFLGGPIELAVENGSARARPLLAEGVLRVLMPEPQDSDALETRVLQWYRSEALAFFRHRVAVYARQLGVEISRLGLSNARTRWGSCSSAGVIRLNWRLIKAPPPVIDYVVAHELAHRIEMNHSPAFWQTVSQLCPDYPELRAYLKAHSAHYHRF
jgi:hypothetical protein